MRVWLQSPHAWTALLTEPGVCSFATQRQPPSAPGAVISGPPAGTGSQQRTERVGGPPLGSESQECEGRSQHPALPRTYLHAVAMEVSRRITPAECPGGQRVSAEATPGRPDRAARTPRPWAGAHPADAPEARMLPGTDRGAKEGSSSGHRIGERGGEYPPGRPPRAIRPPDCPHVSFSWRPDCSSRSRHDGAVGPFRAFQGVCVLHTAAPWEPSCVRMDELMAAGG